MVDSLINKILSVIINGVLYPSIGVAVMIVLVIVAGFCQTFVGALYRTIVINGGFLNYSRLNTTISDVFNGFAGINSINVSSAITTIAIVIVAISTVTTGIKLIVAPINGKEQESPINFLTKLIVVALLLAFYPTIVELITSGMEALNKCKFLNLADDDGTIYTSIVSVFSIAVSAYVSWDSVAVVQQIIMIIVYVAIAKDMFAASLMFVERFIAFAVYLFLGPICIAMYTNKETENVTKDWFMGILSQAIAIFLTCLLFNMFFAQMLNMSELVGGTLESFISNFFGNEVEDTLTGAIGLTPLAKLVSLLAILELAKNSEKFVNMLGFKTMPSQDTFRGFMGGLATIGTAAMAAGKAAQGVGKLKDWKQGTGRRDGYKALAQSLKNDPKTTNMTPQQKVDYMGKQLGNKIVQDGIRKPITENSATGQKILKDNNIIKPDKNSDKYKGTEGKKKFNNDMKTYQDNANKVLNDYNKSNSYVASLGSEQYEKEARNFAQQKGLEYDKMDATGKDKLREDYVRERAASVVTDNKDEINSQAKQAGLGTEAADIMTVSAQQSAAQSFITKDKVENMKDVTLGEFNSAYGTNFKGDEDSAMVAAKSENGQKAYIAMLDEKDGTKSPSVVMLNDNNELLKGQEHINAANSFAKSGFSFTNSDGKIQTISSKEFDFNERQTQEDGQTIATKLNPDGQLHQIKDGQWAYVQVADADKNGAFNGFKYSEPVSSANSNIQIIQDPTGRADNTVVTTPTIIAPNENGDVEPLPEKPIIAAKEAEKEEEHQNHEKLQKDYWKESKANWKKQNELIDKKIETEDAKIENLKARTENLNNRKEKNK